MTTTTTDRPQPLPTAPRPPASGWGAGLTGPLIPVPAATHPGGDLVHPWAD